MATRDRVIPLIALLAATVLAASGCSAQKPAPQETRDSETATVIDAVVVDSSDCLVGDWIIDADQLKLYYDSVGESTGSDFSIEGGAALSMTDSTFVYTPKFSVLVSGQGVDGSGSRISGSMRGSYSTTDGVITTNQETHDTVLTVTVAGMTIDVSAMLDDVLTRAPINSAPYECTTDGPLMYFAAETERVAVQLRAAE